MTTPRSNYVKLRLTDLEKRDWQEAAGGARKLSEWIRSICNEAARRTLRPRMTDLMVSPETIDAMIPNDKPLLVRDAIEEQAHRESRPLPATEAPGDDSSEGDRNSGEGGVGLQPTPPKSKKQCERWMHHRSGVYCGTCKKVIK